MRSDLSTASGSDGGGGSPQGTLQRGGTAEIPMEAAGSPKASRQDWSPEMFSFNC